MEKDKNNDEKEKNNFYFIFVGVKMNNICRKELVTFRNCPEHKVSFYSTRKH